MRAAIVYELVFLLSNPDRIVDVADWLATLTPEEAAQRMALLEDDE